MKIKIGDTIYEANKQPIMVILDNLDKHIISQMPKDKYKFCQHPPNMLAEDVKKFMEIE